VIGITAIKPQQLRLVTIFSVIELYLTPKT
jgi:hypothetical protein